LAGAARELRRNGVDPIDYRREERAKAKLDGARGMTFRQCAEAFIASHEPAWKNEKHRQQWRNTLKTYVNPVFGDAPVMNVDTGLVLQVLEPIWTTKAETASRVRGRIEAVLDWAKAKGARQGENPALWRGHLTNLLPKHTKVARVRHHPALPYAEIPAFMGELRAHSGISHRALEFVILTAARTDEGIGAPWHEVDLDKRLWVVPAERMKGGREHRIPLCSRAIAILKEMAEIRQSDYVFPGLKEDMPLSNMALLMVVREMRPGITVHGFRSTFKDWCAECTHFPNFLSEAALAHVVADKVEAAYRRADLLEKRRKLMEHWAAYCARTPFSAKVISYGSIDRIARPGRGR
jgi:integrase